MARKQLLIQVNQHALNDGGHLSTRRSAHKGDGQIHQALATLPPADVDGAAPYVARARARDRLTTSVRVRVVYRRQLTSVLVRSFGRSCSCAA